MGGLAIPHRELFPILPACEAGYCAAADDGLFHPRHDQLEPDLVTWPAIPLPRHSDGGESQWQHVQREVWRPLSATSYTSDLEWRAKRAVWGPHPDTAVNSKWSLSMCRNAKCQEGEVIMCGNFCCENPMTCNYISPLVMYIFFFFHEYIPPPPPHPTIVGENDVEFPELSAVVVIINVSSLL